MCGLLLAARPVLVAMALYFVSCVPFREPMLMHPLPPVAKIVLHLILCDASLHSQRGAPLPRGKRALGECLRQHLSPPPPCSIL